MSSEHDHPHDHTHPTGPLADASVRIARETDAPAVGFVQAVVWREAYDGVVPPEVLEAFEPQAFASAWRQSLANPPQGVYRLLAACAGDQVVGFASIGPSQDPDADAATGEVSALAAHPHALPPWHGYRLRFAPVDTPRGAGAESVHAWVLAGDEATRAFLAASGLHPDGAFRDRVVSPAGDTAREVRLVADIRPDGPATSP
jgi:hypothetical protein